MYCRWQPRETTSRSPRTPDLTPWQPVVCSWRSACWRSPAARSVRRRRNPVSRDGRQGPWRSGALVGPPHPEAFAHPRSRLRGQPSLAKFRWALLPRRPLIARPPLPPPPPGRTLRRRALLVGREERPPAGTSCRPPPGSNACAPSAAALPRGPRRAGGLDAGDAVIGHGDQRLGATSTPTRTRTTHVFAQDRRPLRDHSTANPRLT